MSSALYRLSALNQISEIKDFLFLSGIAVVRPDSIRKFGITSIVNATTEESTPHVQGVEVIRIRVDDNPSANLSLHFHAIADRIRSVKDTGGKILIHCMAGVSRSASLVLAYLMKYERMTLRQAYFYVKTIRPIIRPNLGFWKQLIDFERRLRGFPSVTLVMTRLCDLPLPDVYSDELRAAERSATPERRSVPVKPAVETTITASTRSPQGTRVGANLLRDMSSSSSTRPYRSIIASHTVPSRLNTTTFPSRPSSFSTKSRTLIFPRSIDFCPF